jgi:hypothetical protein
VWTRTVNGRVLHFYLAGINNQNFLMRDKETGTWWQQITGKAISGPLRGTSLELVLSDELTFGEWKSEVSSTPVLAEVLKEVPKYAKEYDSKWEPETAKYPVVISFPGTPLKSRDVVVGLEMDGPGRAYPWDTLVKESPVVDRVQETPLLVAVGPDGKSFRVFISRIDGKDAEFFLKGEAGDASNVKSENSAESHGDPKDESKSQPKPATPSVTPAVPGATTTPSTAAQPAVPSTATPAAPKPWLLLDTTTASEWNFQGCAVSGPSQGKCLDRVPALKDYWFDWRNYHPGTTIYKH